jgi:hypothetical protein
LYRAIDPKPQQLTNVRALRNVCRRACWRISNFAPEPALAVGAPELMAKLYNAEAFLAHNPTIPTPTPGHNQRFMKGNGYGVGVGG